MASKGGRGSQDEDEDAPAEASGGRVAAMTRKAEQKSDTAKKGKQLRAELDELLRAEKDREAVLQGKTVQPAQQFKLYQTLYEYKSDDPEDLCFDAGEILRWVLRRVVGR